MAKTGTLLDFPGEMVEPAGVTHNKKPRVAAANVGLVSRPGLIAGGPARSAAYYSTRSYSTGLLCFERKLCQARPTGTTIVPSSWPRVLYAAVIAVVFRAHARAPTSCRAPSWTLPAEWLHRKDGRFLPPAGHSSRATCFALATPHSRSPSLRWLRQPYRRSSAFAAKRRLRRSTRA